MKYRVIRSAVAGIILLLITVALCYTPQKRRILQENKKDIILEETLSEIIGQYGNTDNDGNFLYEYIRLPLKSGVQYVEMEFDSKYAQIYYEPSLSYTDDYTAGAAVIVPVDLTIHKAVVSCENATALFIPVSDVDVVKSLRAHSGVPQYEYGRIDFNIKAFIILLIIDAVLLFVIYRYDLLLPEWRSDNIHISKSSIIAVVSVPIVSIVLSTMLNAVLCHLYGGPDSDSSFNWRTWLLVTVFLYVIIWLIKNRKSIYSNIEKVFLIVSLLIGSVMILCGPFGHDGWDVDTHYRYALIDSYMGNAQYTATDIYFLTARYPTLVKNNRSENLDNIPVLNKEYGDVITSNKSGISLPHLPSGIGMAVARLFGLPFYYVYLFAKFANLIFYTIVIYYALKRLKTGRLLLLMIALIPTNVFMASCIDYDAWIISLSLLAMAIFIGECQQENNTISWKSVLLMITAFALACLPKQVYLPMMLIPFFLPKDKLPKRKWLYYLLIVLSIVLLLVSLLMRSQYEFDRGGDIRGGADVDATAQLKYIFGHKWKFLALLMNFVPAYISFTSMELAVTNFGNLGSISFGANIVIAMLFITVALDRKLPFQQKYNIKLSLYTVLLYIGEAVLIATAFYLVYTAVGADQIVGTQARYLTPFIYPMLAAIIPYNDKMNIDLDKLAYIELLLLSFVYLYDIIQIFEVRMLI